LEEELGVKLFNRLTRKVELTETGRKYLSEISDAFGLLRAATDRLKIQQEHATLKISALPSIGSLWLMPRLGSFTREYPNIETRISSSIEPINLHAGEADVAIRVGPKPGHQYDHRAATIDLIMTEQWRGILAEELAPDILVPVYSPNILEPDAQLDEEDIFHTLPLIHTSSRADAWNGWAKHYGLKDLPATPRIEFGHFFMSLDAARQGLGVAIIPEIILDNSNLNGLYCASDYKTRSAGEYYLLTLAQSADMYHIAAFRSWAKREFRKTLRNTLL
jgi:LysR family glycine cleavage system transcriptional activator